MKTIQLSRNQIALVDDADFEWLNQWKWSAQKKKYNWYAFRTQVINGHRTYISMHRVILGLTDPKIDTDHRDRNGLNNQRSNLRIASRTQNQQNRRRQSNNTSGFSGINWHKAASKFIVRLHISKQRVYLGTFTNLDDAVVARNKAIKQTRGEFASFS